MESIGGLLRAIPNGKKTTERGELVTFFTDEINAERRGTKYPPMTEGRMRYMLTALKLSDLYYLASVCKDNKRRGFSFSAKFFYELKPKEL